MPTFQHSNILTIKLGAQDCFWEKKGAYTGEISPTMLKDLGCQYVLLGHSERKRLGETDEIINKKLKAALSAKLNPIFCLGETEKERDEGEIQNILKSQLEKGLNKISKKEIKNIVIAYEPVWAIGTGNPCHPSEAKKVLLFLRKFFKKNLILYGGSVNSKNATPYIKEAKFQGLLIGGASLNAKEFIKIVKNLST
ncbi:MAG: triose-phosphate isomerase [Candidatus Nealsonbacteria bacterium CG_4_10_14_0_8_um_filter_35_10]|uniref:Triosephosphate isomerase n=1 Tax=Candidatus Nealsonbacteria bacterium CG_4_10_14_0_8_um_filter_35_10 TaxID=1974683 RepID=A0A2M7R828_9BACT|nr:MAG: triose-phosphate isomerase [Candidatus Nealsonbacteria bacterium CG_4_10_14_0_8_um_filter_35_10]